MSRRGKKSNKRTEKRQKKVTRCKNKMIPVFENDTCKDFITKEKTESNHNCKNCYYSF